MTTGGDAPSPSTVETGTKPWAARPGVWGLAASLVGVQALVASGALSAQVLVLLPANGPVAKGNDGLLRGYALAMDEARACDARTPSTELGWLPVGQDPRPLFEGRTTPKLLVAPAAVSMLPYGLLAQDRRINVLFPLQRGDSLQRLPGQLGADWLWPVSPARSLEADRLARGLLEQEKAKVMIIHDGSVEQKALADRFTETLAGGGGWVVGPTNAPLAVPKTDKEAIEQLSEDVDWYKPQSLAVMAAPGGALAKAVLSAQWPANLTLVWPFPVKEPLATAQLGVEPLSQGAGWSRFAKAFQARFGFEPGLVEAAGYDTGQLAVLSAQVGGDDGRWQLSWLDPKAPQLELCAALKALGSGSPLAVKGAGSRLDLSPGLSPTGEIRLTPLAPAVQQAEG
ncbi:MULTISPECIES: ABC transporter substrate-binding protein [unclassified Synechococcus]|uniref:ABC transporter substrate-binding protein n=1 Tax=unclassified Synechococcus TaxID=2626047 RepID=UPI000A6CCE68|nr:MULTISPECIES: histidine kinase [unclassified Synechococcus]TWB91873.1 hypothetical protein FB106_10674 [Synechococcus sp. Ace-Pa]